MLPNRPPGSSVDDHARLRRTAYQPTEKLGFQRAFNLFAISALALFFAGGAIVLVCVAVYGLIFD